MITALTTEQFLKSLIHRFLVPVVPLELVKLCGSRVPQVFEGQISVEILTRYLELQVSHNLTDTAISEGFFLGHGPMKLPPMLNHLATPNHGVKSGGVQPRGLTIPILWSVASPSSFAIFVLWTSFHNCCHGSPIIAAVPWIT